MLQTHDRVVYLRLRSDLHDALKKEAKKEKHNAIQEIIRRRLYQVLDVSSECDQLQFPPLRFPSDNGLWSRVEGGDIWHYEGMLPSSIKSFWRTVLDGNP